MTTTQLFVELLVIGLGVLIWVALFIAGLLGVPFEKSIFDIKWSIWPPLLGLAYVFGILLDRFMYSVFNRRHNIIMRHILCDNKYLEPPILERMVMNDSEPLNYMIHYNRSRSRICRAWFLNFLLIGASFAIWQYRVNQISNPCLLVIVLLLLFLSALSCWIGGKLEEDYCYNIHWSYKYISEKKQRDSNIVS